MFRVSHEKSGASLQAGTITGRQSAFRIIAMLTFLLVPRCSFAVAITNSVTVSDCLGRVITVTTPLGVTSNSYDGTSSRILCSTFTAGDVQTETFYLYNALGDRVGTERNGVFNRTDSSYEQISNYYWKVDRQVTANHNGITNSVEETYRRVTGLSRDFRKHEIEISPDGVKTCTRLLYDEGTGVASEIVESSVNAPVTNYMIHGFTVKSSTANGIVFNRYDGFGRHIATAFKENEGASPHFVNRLHYNAASDLIRMDTFVSPSNFVSESYVYDNFGNRIAVTNAAGDVAFSQYDYLGRIISLSGAAVPIRCTYDTFGNRTSLSTTPDGISWNTTSWTYDLARSLCVWKTLADGSRYAYTYTPDALPALEVRPSGKWMLREYDNRRNLSSKRYSVTGRGIDFAHDDFGALTNVIDDAGTSHSYVRGRNSKIGTDHCVVQGVTSRIEYLSDDFNRTTGMVHFVDGNMSSRARCLYDNANRLSEITVETPEYGIVNVVYANTLGRSSGYTISLPNGATILKQRLFRDDFRRNLVQQITTMNGTGNVLASFSYGYDELGRPVVRNNDLFAYDGRGQIATFCVGTNSWTYAWNDAESPISEVRTGPARLFEVHSLNQCVGVTENGGNTSSTIVRDPDGGVASFKDWIYQYDEENRLSMAVLVLDNGGGARIRSRYDYLGRRIMRDIDVKDTATSDWVPRERRMFAYDGDNLIYERTMTYMSGETNNVVTKYFWGKDISETCSGAGGVGGLLFLIRDGTICFPVYDAMGNVVLYADANGGVVAAYAYNAFGSIVGKSGPLADSLQFRFSTKYYEEETGLYYFGYRFLNPEILQWMTPDPSGEQGGVNLYAFCGNAPTYSYDPNGQLKIPFITNQAKQAWENVIRSVLDKRGWCVAAFLMRHSLKDNPGPLEMGEEHFVSRAIKASPEYRQIVEELVARQRETYEYYDSSSPIAYKTGDLFAGIGRATVHYRGYICKTATGTRVDFDVTVSDDYDFHFLVSDYYRSSVDGVLGTIANNMAWSDQYFEVITKYKWTAKFKDKR